MTTKTRGYHNNEDRILLPHSNFGRNERDHIGADERIVYHMDTSHTFQDQKQGKTKWESNQENRRL
jgi:hypothetical protein